MGADLDGGGTLDRAEMRLLGKSLGLEDDEQLEKAIAQMDTDNDDEISLEEFLEWWRTQDQAHEEAGSAGKDTAGEKEHHCRAFWFGSPPQIG